MLLSHNNSFASEAVIVIGDFIFFVCHEVLINIIGRKIFSFTKDLLLFYMFNF